MFADLDCSSVWLFVLLTCSISDAKADRRVALVVGNSNYSNASLFLANPKNDAEDVAAALRGVGFEVLQAIDANKRDLDLNMAKFAQARDRRRRRAVLLCRPARQYQGRNFLMPTDAEVEDEISFRYQMTPLDDVRAALDRGDGVKIVILDACRNNPIVNALRRKKKPATAAASMRCVAGSPRSTRRRAWWSPIPPRPMKSPPMATAATARSPARS